MMKKVKYQLFKFKSSTFVAMLVVREVDAYEVGKFKNGWLGDEHKVYSIGHN